MLVPSSLRVCCILDLIGSDLLLTFHLPPVLILAIAVGVQERPAAAPQEGVWVSDFKLTNTPDFASAVSAVSSLIFAFGGIPAYFNIQSEMKDPRLYTRSLIVCQSTVCAVYITIGIVVYYYCGSYVASPALGSAGHTMKKVCYGVALPGLFVSTILTTHVSVLDRVSGPRMVD